MVVMSDEERTRSPSPSSFRKPRHSTDRTGRSSAFANSHGHEKSPAAHRYQPLQSKAEQMSHPRLAIKSRTDSASASMPAPPGSDHPILQSGQATTHRRSRPETSHQRAVNMNRKMRMDHILHKQLTTAQGAIRREKRKSTSSFGMLAIKRIWSLPDLYDTEDEDSWGPGGLVPNPEETEDFGEEAVRHRKVIDRALRRLQRDDNNQALAAGLQIHQQRKRKMREPELDDSPPVRKRRRPYVRHPKRPVAKVEEPEAAEEGLDDLDLDLLGENRDDERSDGDSIGEVSEAADGDMTEEEIMNEV